MDESRPRAWFSRRGFTHTRKGLILLWLGAGFFLLAGYKLNLRASLITIDYEKKLETLDDMAQSGILMQLIKNDILFAPDTRPAVQKLFKNALRLDYEWTGGIFPTAYYDR